MQNKKVIRRSTAEELLFGCELAGMLALNGAESIGNENTSAGTAGHKIIQVDLENGVISENIAFAMNGINPADCQIEKLLQVELDNMILTCTPDCYVIKGNKAIIYDWKFTQSAEQYIIDGYKYKTFQPLFYAYILYKLNDNLESILFQYVLPNTQDIVEPAKYHISKRPEIISEFETSILPKLEKYADFDVDNAYPDFSKCNSCFYKSDCRFMKPELLEKKSELILKESFEITQSNVGDVYNFCNQLESKIKDIKDSIKERMISGELSSFSISDSKCIELTEKAGRASLNKDLLNEFLKTYNKSYDDFTEQSEPIKSLQQKKIKAV